MVWRYERIRNANTISSAPVTGTTSENAAIPITGTRTRKISSVAYAADDKLSDANTASAVGLPRRWSSSVSVDSGGRSSRFFSRYLRLSGTIGTRARESRSSSPNARIAGSAGAAPAVSTDASTGGSTRIATHYETAAGRALLALLPAIPERAHPGLGCHLFVSPSRGGGGSFDATS